MRPGRQAAAPAPPIGCARPQRAPPPPRPVTPNKGGDWRGRLSPPGGAAPPHAPEPRIHRESEITLVGTPRGCLVRGAACDPRLSPPSVTPVPNRGFLVKRVCPARLVPALPGGTVVPSP